MFILIFINRNHSCFSAVMHMIGTGVLWHMQKPGQRKWRELDRQMALMAEQNYQQKSVRIDQSFKSG